MTYEEARELIDKWRSEHYAEEAMKVCWDWLMSIDCPLVSYFDVVNTPDRCIAFATHLLTIKLLGVDK